jgi:glycosyltransferase involved in cell wall biosynthesis
MFQRGGSIQSAQELSSRLAARGHEVSVYTTDMSDSAFELQGRKKINLDGLDIYPFHNVSQKLADKNLTFAPGMVGALKKNIKDFDIVHIHELRHAGAVLAHHYAEKFDVPYVFQAHGTMPSVAEKKGLKWAYDALWSQGIVNDSALGLALTPTEKGEYLQAGMDDGRIEIVPNGLDLAQYQELPSKGEFRGRWGIGMEEQVILFLGRLHRIKGIDLLIDAYSNAIDSLPGTRLVIVGPDDGHLDDLKRMANERGIAKKIIFTGPLTGRDKIMAYVDSDVYVLPSRYEAFGRTILEACACGTPVIMSEKCGLADVIDGRAGQAVNCMNGELREALIDVLGDDQARRRYGQAGRELAFSDYGWDNIMDRVEKAYEKGRSAS